MDVDTVVTSMLGAGIAGAFAYVVTLALLSHRAKEALREHSVPVPRSKLEAQAIMAATPMRVAMEDKKKNGYDHDIVVDMRGNHSYWRSYPDGRVTTKPFAWRAGDEQRAADDRLLRGVVLVTDAEGFGWEEPMTPEELNDPQRYRGCIRMPKVPR